MSIGYGVSFRHSAKAIVANLCFFRLWLGLGIGGDYLLSATIMLEYSNKKTQVSFIADVFARQGFEMLGGGIF
jgi:PHS family inorganic phosphate transporter-like MFS transporter